VHPIFRYWPCLIDREKVKPQVQLLEAIAQDETAERKRTFEQIEQVIFSKARQYYGENQTVEVHVDRITGSPTVRINGQDLDADALGELLDRITAQDLRKIMSQKSRESQTEPNGAHLQTVIVERSNHSPGESRKFLGDIAIARSGDKGTTANIGVISRRPDDYAALKNWLTSDRVAKFLAPLGITGVQRFEWPNLHALNFLVHGILARGLRCDAQGKALGQVLLEMPLDPELDDDNE
jgi:hypothetical protein